MLDALMDAGYSLRDAAAALNLSATDLLDASESAAQPLAALDAFSRRVAELQVLDSRMQALKALVKVCNDATDLEKKRLAAQAILRFDPFRHAPPSGELSPRPRQRRAVTEGAFSTTRSTEPHSHPNPDYADTGAAGAAFPMAAPSASVPPTPLPVPHTPRVGVFGAAPSVGRVPRLDRPLPFSTPSSSSIAGKPCEESSIPAPGVAGPAGTQPAAPSLRPPPAASAATQPRDPARPPFTPSPLHPITPSAFTPSGVTARALAAAAGHAISVYALIPHSARAPPLRAAA